jgi:hypothetical protein
MTNVWGIEFDTDKIIENFNSYQSFAKAKQISLENIPVAVMNIFEGWSRRFILPSEYTPKDFIFSLSTDFEGGDSSYSALHPLIYTRGRQHEGAKEFDLYSVELTPTNEINGHFELRYQPDSNHPYFKNKPFAGYAETEEGFQRQGKGMRKYRTMNALSQAIFGFPLHTDTLMGEEEKKMFEKFVRLGEMEHYLEDGKDRFVFV